MLSLGVIETGTAYIFLQGASLAEGVVGSEVLPHV
jgi:hypothetical protein